MGGAVIIGASLLGYVVGAPGHAATPPTMSGVLVLFLMTGLGLVGFLDDFIKISKQRSLGPARRAEARRADAGRGRSSRSWRCSSRTSTFRTPASTDISFVRDTNVDLAFAGTAGRAAPVRRLGQRHDRRHSQRREPHRRPRRAGHRRHVDGVRRLRAHRHLAVQPELPDRPGHQVLRGARPARPRRRRRRVHGRLLRVPVVERLAGQDLHGRHRLAGPRRRARRARHHHPHRAAAGHPRRPVRHRSRSR